MRERLVAERSRRAGATRRGAAEGMAGYTHLKSIWLGAGVVVGCGDLGADREPGTRAELVRNRPSRCSRGRVAR